MENEDDCDELRKSLAFHLASNDYFSNRFKSFASGIDQLNLFINHKK